jgi:hypothetical protein
MRGALQFRVQLPHIELGAQIFYRNKSKRQVMELCNAGENRLKTLRIFFAAQYQGQSHAPHFNRNAQIAENQAAELRKLCMLNKVLPKVKITNCIGKFISKRILASASS